MCIAEPWIRKNDEKNLSRGNDWGFGSEWGSILWSWGPIWLQPNSAINQLEW